MLKSTDSFFDGFGEIYFSTINDQAIKGWKKHLKISQNIIVPSGRVKFVFYDDREGFGTKGLISEVELGPLPSSNYGLLKIPSQVWYSFKGIAKGESLIVNCIPSVHDPKECLNVNLETEIIPYDWD